MNKLKYKGYIGAVDYSKEDQVFFGKIEHINGLVNFEGVNEKELKVAFEKAVDDYLAYCQTNSVFPYVIPMLRVVDVDYIKDYELLATFSNGSKKNIDLKPYLTGEVFGELLDKDKFTQYSLTNVTIEWANGADLAPEFLYEIGTDHNTCRTVEVIVEQSGDNLSAYIEVAPIITVGDDLKEIELNMKEAIELYLEDNANPVEILTGDFELSFKLIQP
jgi:predicted RNase H-like HicB family nuclease